MGKIFLILVVFLLSCSNSQQTAPDSSNKFFEQQLNQYETEFLKGKKTKSARPWQSRKLVFYQIKGAKSLGGYFEKIASKDSRVRSFLFVSQGQKHPVTITPGNGVFLLQKGPDIFILKITWPKKINQKVFFYEGSFSSLKVPANMAWIIEKGLK